MSFKRPVQKDRPYLQGRPYIVRGLLAIAVVCAVFTLTTRSATPAFFPDDPLQVDNDRAVDAGKAARIDGSNAYDFAEQTFLNPGDPEPRPAVNVNTIDEVPDSSWF